jgi:hypothetical protein
LPNRYDGGAMTRRHQTTPLSRHAKAWLKPLIALVALVLVFEEWLWAQLRDGVHRLSHWPAVRRFEGALKRLSPWASLAVLLTPMVVLLPFKVGALWLLGHGHVLWGVLTLITAKLTGTAVAAYLFDLVRNQARQLRWFDRLYCRVESLLARAHAWLHRQPLYTEARDRVRLLGIRWHAIWGKWRQQWRSHPPVLIRLFGYSGGRRVGLFGFLLGRSLGWRLGSGCGRSRCHGGRRCDRWLGSSRGLCERHRSHQTSKQGNKELVHNKSIHLNRLNTVLGLHLQRSSKAPC